MHNAVAQMVMAGPVIREHEAAPQGGGPGAGTRGRDTELLSHTNAPKSPESRCVYDPGTKRWYPLPDGAGKITNKPKTLRHA